MIREDYTRSVVFHLWCSTCQRASADDHVPLFCVTCCGVLRVVGYVERAPMTAGR